MRPINSLIVNILSLLSIIMLVLVYLPLMTIFIPPIAYFGYKTAILYLRSSREITRMDSIIKS